MGFKEMELFSKQLFLCAAIFVSDVCISIIASSRSGKLIELTCI